jgi:hypothetical protein
MTMNAAVQCSLASLQEENKNMMKKTKNRRCPNHSLAILYNVEPVKHRACMKNPYQEGNAMPEERVM